VTAFMDTMAGTTGVAPPNRPTHTSLPALRRAEAEVEGGGRAHEVDRCSHAAGGLEQGLERAIGLGVDDLARARLAGNVPLARVELHHDRGRLEHLARQADARQAHATGANDEQGILGTECAHLLQGAVGGQARAGIGAGLLLGEVAIVQQVLRIRHHRMGGKSAVAMDAQGAWAVAQMLVAGLAQRAAATADPREHHATPAHLHALRVGAHGHDRACNLMAQGARRLHGAGHVQLDVVSEVKVAIVQVHIAVADPATAHPHHHLAALGRRSVAQHLGQRPAEFLNLVTGHGHGNLRLWACI